MPESKKVMTPEKAQAKVNKHKRLVELYERIKQGDFLTEEEVNQLPKDKDYEAFVKKNHDLKLKRAELNLFKEYEKEKKIQNQTGQIGRRIAAANINEKNLLQGIDENIEHHNKEIEKVIKKYESIINEISSENKTMPEPTSSDVNAKFKEKILSLKEMVTQLKLGLNTLKEKLEKAYNQTDNLSTINNSLAQIAKVEEKLQAEESNLNNPNYQADKVDQFNNIINIQNEITEIGESMKELEQALKKNPPKIKVIQEKSPSKKSSDTYEQMPAQNANNTSSQDLEGKKQQVKEVLEEVKRALLVLQALKEIVVDAADKKKIDKFITNLTGNHVSLISLNSNLLKGNVDAFDDSLLENTKKNLADAREVLTRLNANDLYNIIQSAHECLGQIEGGHEVGGELTILRNELEQFKNQLQTTSTTSNTPEQNKNTYLTFSSRFENLIPRIKSELIKAKTSLLKTLESLSPPKEELPRIQEIKESKPKTLEERMKEIAELVKAAERIRQLKKAPPVSQNEPKTEENKMTNTSNPNNQNPNQNPGTTAQNNSASTGTTNPPVGTPPITPSSTTGSQPAVGSTSGTTRSTTNTTTIQTNSNTQQATSKSPAIANLKKRIEELKNRLRDYNPRDREVIGLTRKLGDIDVSIYKWKRDLAYARLYPTVLGPLPTEESIVNESNQKLDTFASQINNLPSSSLNNAQNTNSTINSSPPISNPTNTTQGTQHISGVQSNTGNNSLSPVPNNDDMFDGLSRLMDGETQPENPAISEESAQPQHIQYQPPVVQTISRISESAIVPSPQQRANESVPPQQQTQPTYTLQNLITKAGDLIRIANQTLEYIRNKHRETSSNVADEKADSIREIARLLISHKLELTQAQDANPAQQPSNGQIEDILTLERNLLNLLQQVRGIFPPPIEQPAQDPMQNQPTQAQEVGQISQELRPVPQQPQLVRNQGTPTLQDLITETEGLLTSTHAAIETIQRAQGGNPEIAQVELGLIQTFARQLREHYLNLHRVADRTQPATNDQIQAITNFRTDLNALIQGARAILANQPPVDQDNLPPNPPRLPTSEELEQRIRGLLGQATPLRNQFPAGGERVELEAVINELQNMLETLTLPNPDIFDLERATDGLSFRIKNLILENLRRAAERLNTEATTLQSQLPPPPAAPAPAEQARTDLNNFIQRDLAEQLQNLQAANARANIEALNHNHETLVTRLAQLRPQVVALIPQLANAPQELQNLLTRNIALQQRINEVSANVPGPGPGVPASALRTRLDNIQRSLGDNITATRNLQTRLNTVVAPGQLAPFVTQAEFDNLTQTTNNLSTQFTRFQLLRELTGQTTQLRADATALTALYPVPAGAPAPGSVQAQVANLIQQIDAHQAILDNPLDNGMERTNEQLRTLQTTLHDDVRRQLRDLSQTLQENPAYIPRIGENVGQLRNYLKTFEHRDKAYSHGRALHELEKLFDFNEQNVATPKANLTLQSATEIYQYLKTSLNLLTLNRAAGDRNFFNAALTQVKNRLNDPTNANPPGPINITEEELAPLKGRQGLWDSIYLERHFDEHYVTRIKSLEAKTKLAPFSTGEFYEIKPQVPKLTQATASIKNYLYRYQKALIDNNPAAHINQINKISKYLRRLDKIEENLQKINAASNLTNFVVFGTIRGQNEPAPVVDDPMYAVNGGPDKLFKTGVVKSKEEVKLDGTIRIDCNPIEIGGARVTCETTPLHTIQDNKFTITGKFAGQIPELITAAQRISKGTISKVSIPHMKFLKFAGEFIENARGLNPYPEKTPRISFTALVKAIKGDPAAPQPVTDEQALAVAQEIAEAIQLYCHLKGYAFRMPDAPIQNKPDYVRRQIKLVEETFIKNKAEELIFKTGFGISKETEKVTDVKTNRTPRPGS